MRLTTLDDQVIFDFEGNHWAHAIPDIRRLAQSLTTIDGVSSVLLTWASAPRIVLSMDSNVGKVGILRRSAARLRTSPHNLQRMRNSSRSHSPLIIIRFPNLPLDDAMGDEEPMAETAHVSVRTDRSLLSRIVDGTLALGSFLMTWVGLLIPGVPTIPFAIMTVYFADRASPRLSNALCNSPIIGSTMRDWRDYRGIRRATRVRIYFGIGLLVVVTLLLAQPSAILYTSMSVMVALTIYFVQRLPLIDEIDGDPTPSERLPSYPRLGYAGG